MIFHRIVHQVEELEETNMDRLRDLNVWLKDGNPHCNYLH